MYIMDVLPIYYRCLAYIFVAYCTSIKDALARHNRMIVGLVQVAKLLKKR